MRILIANPFGIGDVLFSTPLVNNLKAAYPDSYIGYICNIRAKDILYGNPQINKIFVFEKDEYRDLWQKSKFQCIKKFISFLVKIRKEKFNLVVDLSLSQQYNFFLWLIGIKKRIGYNYRKRGRLLTHKIDINGYNDKPVADYYLDLLKLLDIKPTLFNLRMDVLSGDKSWADEFFKNLSFKQEDLIIGIIPAGGASWGRDFSYRHWPWENYAKLADRLIAELGAKIIIFGASSEETICRRLQNAMAQKAINVCGQTSLKQFAALLSLCNLAVCNDGGPLHVAVSQGVMTVSVFGPVDEKVYGPYPPGPRHIVVTKDMDCRPCYKKFKLPGCLRERQCIRDISVEEVLKIIKDNLKELKNAV
ncbi:MAG: lipopolysaccharide heptosyltransferase II [Candidatus Omnitrophota bacterium]|nr:MAG: lipopolysaccharide heptosyltransferase II [Candidatus Omnitrophota bacterium]